MQATVLSLAEVNAHPVVETLDVSHDMMAHIFILVQKCPFLPELDVDELARLLEVALIGDSGRQDGKVTRSDMVLLGLSVLPTTSEVVWTRVKSIVSGLTADEVVVVLDAFREQAQGKSKSFVSGVFDCGIAKVG